jgi:hypothetical protein
MDAMSTRAKVTDFNSTFRLLGILAGYTDIKLRNSTGGMANEDAPVHLVKKLFCASKPGTNVMIFKYFLRKNRRFLLKTKLNYAKIGS